MLEFLITWNNLKKKVSVSNKQIIEGVTHLPVDEQIAIITTILANIDLSKVNEGLRELFLQKLQLKIEQHGNERI